MGRGGDGVTPGRTLRSRVVLAGKSDETVLEAPARSTSTFSVCEVARHTTPEDCWLIIKGKVYDVSGWAAGHPGGAVIYTHGGKDATDTFSAFHSPQAWNTLRSRQIGVCDEEPPRLLQDFRALRSSMQSDGLFASSKVYYVMKASSNLAICALSLALLAFSDTYLSVIAAACLMALFWQQCGWLAHDFLHHQVFNNRALNNAAGVFFGNFCQGFSVAWWKDKHNAHHAAPNELNEGLHAVDPDIDTLPILAWSTDMLEELSASQRGLVRLQHWLLFPVLFVARVSWCIQSLAFPFTHTLGFSKHAVEVLTLAAHYAWLLTASFSLLPPLKAGLFVLLSELVCGILLGFVFIQSHNGMEVYSDSRNFVASQLASTRNVHASLFNDWFTGGLNRQIEHHLFPTLPRHNLHKAQVLVRALCSKHGLYYEDCSMSTATIRVLLRLREVAHAA